MGGSKMRRLSILSLLLTVVIPSAVFAAEKAKIIEIDGSSTVYPITEAVAEEFQKLYRDVRVVVGISGTGGGFKRFGAGETDISDASRPIKQKEADVCKKNGVEYVELAVAYDGLAVMVNPDNKWVDFLTVAELKKIWEPNSQGVVIKWNQIRPGFPDKELRLFGPGTDSGTFDYFTEVICGKSGASRGDFTASEDDNVLVQGIASDELALGYFGLAYYEHNTDKLKIVPIDDGNNANGKGAIVPTLETVRNGTYQPLSRPLFIYVSVKSAQKKEVRDFVEFYLKNAPELSKEVGYIPLPDKMYKASLEKFHKAIGGAGKPEEKAKK
jgi:phosphate transport system substrate-binding protein